MAFTRLLFPEPETPLTQVKAPRGIFTEMSLRLFSLAPSIMIDFPFPFLLVLGMGIVFLPARYWPVNDSSLLIKASDEP
jgi:hypothetical protein